MVEQSNKKIVKKTVKKTASKKIVKKKNKEQTILDFVIKKLDDGKAENIVSLNIGDKSSMADYLIIATGTSSRHVMSLCHNLAIELKKKGFSVPSDYRQGDGSWVVLDFGDIIIHTFTAEMRLYYGLEELWH